MYQDFQDETLVCRDCNNEFVFSASEQAFYAEKGFLNKPARCRDCRAARKRTQDGGNTRQMFDAVCEECGQPCQVPFQPNGNKPVYCNNCFQSRRPARY